MHQKKDKYSPPQLICHPLAVPAFELSQVIFSMRGSEPSEHKLLLLSRTHRLKYFQRADGKHVFLSGWVALNIGLTIERKQNVVNSPSNIELMSWTYLVESILMLSKRSEVLSNLLLFFSRVPDKVKSRLFDGRVPRTLLAQLVAFTGESRASVRHYLSSVGDLS